MLWKEIKSVNKQRVKIEEEKVILVTPDNKCILKGSPSDKLLVLIDEETVNPVLTYKGNSGVTGKKIGRYIRVTDAVKELYDIEGCAYDQQEFGELKPVQAQSTLVFEL